MTANDKFQTEAMSKIMRENQQPRGPDRRVLEHYSAQLELAREQEKASVMVAGMTLADTAKLYADYQQARLELAKAQERIRVLESTLSGFLLGPIYRSARLELAKAQERIKELENATRHCIAVQEAVLAREALEGKHG